MSVGLSINCKKCVRFGEKLCSKPPGKCGLERKRLRRNAYMPMKRLSNYGVQLKEKQKARIIYGILERQFKNYVKRASTMRGVAGENLLGLLESRLDNVVFRLGFGRSRTQARQLVSHGHFLVNDKKVNVPSFRVKQGDKIEFTEKAKKTEMFKLVTVEEEPIVLPNWLNKDKEQASGTIIAQPETDDVEIGIQTRLIVEYYSRR